ncbi:MAG: XRE family transcriptional regulator [Chloroflexi bacterium HGW-Chloroflexi-4]|jgi:AraC family transcriptional regulator of adaptative response/methylated-DNA-[protein]-cysteine methyltransferase|nr:MAG: XRE family transcriptional regulator [Chloroflexi bacterium HGW-Chloroflexi-4]
MNRLTLKPDTLYAALLQRDSNFEGIAVVCVKTTGIFCRFTCTARKPKPENVEFMATPHEALLHGYRPCKVCNPMNHQGSAPEWIQPLLAEINENPTTPLHNQDLRIRGMDPARVSRWFKKNHNMTFQAYLRSLRIGQAFGRLKQGESVTGIAFESGYDSLSGFTESFRRATRLSPSESRQENIIYTTRILTPIGPMLAGAAQDGICLLEFVDRRMLETQIKRVTHRLQAKVLLGESPFFKMLSNQLDEYFAAKRRTFTVPLVLAGTPFQQSVWNLLQTIPYGETRSYKQQAAALGDPAAIRAVARANGDNRISILIPCHRVIGATGELVGYGGGLWRKQHLLKLEHAPDDFEN